MFSIAPMSRILVVDDQAAVRTALEVLFDVHDLPAESVASPKEALARIAAGGVGVVVQDMNFTANATSGDEGEALFRAIRARDPHMPVLLMTAWTSLETAVRLVKEGAADYVAKPWDDEKLVATVRTLLQLRDLQEENERLRSSGLRAREALAKEHDLCGLVYASDSMHQVVSLALQVARSDVTVLITGPNGSGKEKLAEIVQAGSRRRDKPFVRVNAGALPDNLLEAELFGAEAGAFTGAQKRSGRFEAADGGTLFLDELGNLTLAGQAKLLRVLQTGEFQRLGSNTVRKADVRIIAATNADLVAMIREKTFREDLYFRVNVIELRIPPLAARREDVLPLAEDFLAHVPDAPPGVRYSLTDEGKRALLAYSWPGNVRELHNRLRRAALLAASGVLGATELGLDEAPGQKLSAAPPAPQMAKGEADIDRATIESALERAEGKIARAAAELGISRQALYRRMEKLGVTLERRVRGDG
jgi:DNA-binding NtrC family response regulator